MYILAIRLGIRAFRVGDVQKEGRGPFPFSVGNGATLGSKPEQQLKIRIPAISGLMAFEAVARLSSFSKAAEELSVTQSAVSHRISQLEAQLGTRLFIRVGANTSLTPHGEQLLEHVVRGLDCFREGIMSLQTSQRSVIRLSLPPALASNWLILRLSSFQRIHPEVELEISVTSRFLNLRAGEADVAIRFGNGQWDGLDAIKLLPVRIFPVCSPSYLVAHPWLKAPSNLEGATLLRQTITPWKPWFEAAGLPWEEPTQGTLFSEVSLLIEAAECSQGVGLVLSALVKSQLESGVLLKLFDVVQETEKAYYVVMARNAEHSLQVRRLIDWLIDNA
ncbi:LysR substrate-binding domain-containing protein [Paraburkholderia lacunae]|uniref:LysR substrate-binding domain-containing protein n=1 Tax=Paraburkholderia lacunae TaxID=2211104 RepID=UPI001402B4EF|nr:LysR substrate-binding domain-containing protein [Paraburkholderia lacunae]